MAFSRRRSSGPGNGPTRPQIAPPEAHDVPPEGEPLDGEVMPSQASLGADIPPHVWALLQQAGELAAARLVEVIQSPRFASYAPSAQRGLIELALTRAYGLPVRKALNVNLSTSDSDAVAASLADLASNLPENARSAVRDALSDRFGDDPT